MTTPTEQFREAVQEALADPIESQACDAQDEGYYEIRDKALASIQASTAKLMLELVETLVDNPDVFEDLVAGSRLVGEDKKADFIAYQLELIDQLIKDLSK